MYFERAMNRYEYKTRRLYEFINHTPGEEMKERYGRDWKREIGIDIACLDEDNARLPYPIKICKTNGHLYNELPASMGDPGQGCY